MTPLLRAAVARPVAVPLASSEAQKKVIVGVRVTLGAGACGGRGGGDGSGRAVKRQ